MADTYATIAPIYIGGAILSFVSCAYAIRMSLKEGKRLFRASPSTLILLLTLLDAAYALKFAVSAVVWYATGSSPDDSRSSFHGINDNCLLSVMYEQLVGMACVCLNAVSVPLACVPSSLSFSPLPSQCWIFNFVYMLNNPLINTNHHM